MIALLLPVVLYSQAQDLYNEPLRPQFHFTARQWTTHLLNPGQRLEGWVNDLNGLIYYDGAYNLFAQRWAKCWIHATSKDLVHWTEQQPAFWEESDGSGVQSGTCVIDYDNTSGLSPDKKNPPMVAFWSRFDNSSQCICYSLDKGKTWTRYPGNPYMIHPERDPKVFWYAPGKHWVMMLYGNGTYQILNSTNLLTWTDTHHAIPNCFECPDFFQLPVDGNRQNQKWVLIQGSGYYSFGSFDGTEFKEESPRRPCDVGPNFYATQTWANMTDGRRVQAAWMRGADFPDMPFNQMVSFPCSLTLRSTSDGIRLYRQPVRELQSLRKSKERLNARNLKAGETETLADSGDLFEIEASLKIPEGAKLTFNIRGSEVVLTSKTLQSGSDPASALGSIDKVQILVDRGSIEAFANDGEISSTRFALPKGDGITVLAEGGDVDLGPITIYRLASIWPKPKA
jgi:sucrose-6-phosphate hydrolase SacC (GH32 family)